MRSNTFAARAGRWSAAHRKTAIFGWLAFVIVAVAIGAAAGTKTPTNDNSYVGDSGRGDKLVSDHYPDSASESVLIQGRHGQTYRDADVRAAVDQTVKAVSGFHTVQNVDSPFAKGNGYRNFIRYTHGSTLRSFQEIFGVSPFLRDAAIETDLSDLFAVFP